MTCVNTRLQILVRCVWIRARLTQNQSSPQMWQRHLHRLMATMSWPSWKIWHHTQCHQPAGIEQWSPLLGDRGAWEHYRAPLRTAGWAGGMGVVWGALWWRVYSMECRGAPSVAFCITYSLDWCFMSAIPRRVGNIWWDWTHDAYMPKRRSQTIFPLCPLSWPWSQWFQLPAHHSLSCSISNHSLSIDPQKSLFQYLIKVWFYDRRLYRSVKQSHKKMWFNLINYCNSCEKSCWILITSFQTKMISLIDHIFHTSVYWPSSNECRRSNKSNLDCK